MSIARIGASDRRVRLLRQLGWISVAALISVALLGPGARASLANDLQQVAPVESPSGEPSGEPSQDPGGSPSDEPSASPSDEPSGAPSEQPSHEPSGEPSASPSDEPSEEPSTTPSDEPSEQAVVGVLKLIDDDGDLSTTTDQSLAAGWMFELSVTGGTSDTASLTSSDTDVAMARVAVDTDSAAVSLTELDVPGYELVDAFCTQGTLIEDDPILTPSLRVADISAMSTDEEDNVGTLVEMTISFDAPRETGTLCVFYNTLESQATPGSPAPTGGVEGATGRPDLTPPATDVATARSERTSDGWRLVVFVLAAFIATMLMLTLRPAGPRRR